MSDKVNLFEIASRNKFRFESNRGELTVEQLWGLPLNTGSVHLDGVAIGLHNKLQSTQTTSFVSKSTAADVETQQKLEIVKHIIEVRLAEKTAATVAAEKASVRKQLREAIAAKETQALVDGDLDTLKKRLAELDD